METTQVLEHGQVMLPEVILHAHHWGFWGGCWAGINYCG